MKLVNLSDMVMSEMNTELKDIKPYLMQQSSNILPEKVKAMMKLLDINILQGATENILFQ